MGRSVLIETFLIFLGVKSFFFFTSRIKLFQCAQGWPGFSHGEGETAEAVGLPQVTSPWPVTRSPGGLVSMGSPGRLVYGFWKQRLMFSHSSTSRSPSGSPSVSPCSTTVPSPSEPPCLLLLPLPAGFFWLCLARRSSLFWNEYTVAFLPRSFWTERWRKDECHAAAVLLARSHYTITPKSFPN